MIRVIGHKTYEMLRHATTGDLRLVVRYEDGTELATGDLHYDAAAELALVVLAEDDDTEGIGDLLDEENAEDIVAAAPGVYAQLDADQLRHVVAQAEGR